MDLIEIGYEIVEWFQLARNRIVQLWAFVDVVMLPSCLLFITLKTISIK
jgi:hypothetical protein